MLAWLSVWSNVQMICIWSVPNHYTRLHVKKAESANKENTHGNQTALLTTSYPIHVEHPAHHPHHRWNDLTPVPHEALQKHHCPTILLRQHDIVCESLQPRHLNVRIINGCSHCVNTSIICADARLCADMYTHLHTLWFYFLRYTNTLTYLLTYLLTRGSTVTTESNNDVHNTCVSTCTNRPCHDLCRVFHTTLRNSPQHSAAAWMSPAESCVLLQNVA